MPRTVPALAVALLLLSAPVAAALSTPPAGGSSAAPSVDSPLLLQSQVTPENTTNVLLLDDVGASNLTRPEADLSTKLDVQRSELEREYRLNLVETRFDRLDTADARSEFLLNVTDRAAADTADLREAEATARAAYVRGSLSADEYLRTLGYLSARADHLDAVLDRVWRLAPARSEPQTRARHVQSRLVTLQGPIRSDVARVVSGEARPFEVYVAASNDGATLSRLATVGGGDIVYRHETVRLDHLDADATAGLSLTPDGISDEFLPATYPWLVENKRSLDTIGPRGTDAYQVAITHSHGEFEAWIDDSTRQVYHERQEKLLKYYPAGPTEQTLADDLIVTVNRTYAGGPLQVSLTNRTGAPLDGEVRIDGERVGTTGSDGTLWTLGRSGTYEVMVVHEDQRVRVTVSAVGE